MSGVYEYNIDKLEPRLAPLQIAVSEMGDSIGGLLRNFGNPALLRLVDYGQPIEPQLEEPIQPARAGFSATKRAWFNGEYDVAVQLPEGNGSTVMNGVRCRFRPQEPTLTVAMNSLRRMALLKPGDEVPSGDKTWLHPSAVISGLAEAVEALKEGVPPQGLRWVYALDRPAPGSSWPLHYQSDGIIVHG